MTDRLIELDRLGRGDDMEAVLLNRVLDLGGEGVAHSVTPGLGGASEPAGFGGQDRPAPSLDHAA